MERPWAAIAVGARYYLFGDFHPANSRQLQVGWFTTDELGKPFQWCSSIGRGHPDPDIGFAGGRFYLFTQQRTDYVSPGPWVDGVEVRVGVDTNGDGNVDRWTVKETYGHLEGFAKQIETKPARLDTSSLPAGFGFQFEPKLTDKTVNASKPMIDRVDIVFE